MGTLKYRKQVWEFRRKYKVKKITVSSMIQALEKQGYTVIEFNGIEDNEDVAVLRDALNIGSFMQQSCCFSYKNEKYRLVFLHEDLTEEEKLLVLAHEEGHIWNHHLTINSVFGDDVVQEYEAHEFAHELLRKRILSDTIPFLIGFSVTGLMICVNTIIGRIRKK